MLERRVRLDGTAVRAESQNPDRDSLEEGAKPCQSLGLAAADDYTFQVNLSRPDPAFIWLAAMPSGAPIRQDVVARSGDRWSAAPDTLVTNGPFRVSEMVVGDHITVARNPHYWGAKSTLTDITFVVVKDGAAALEKFKSGGLDVMDVQPAQAAGVTADAHPAAAAERFSTGLMPYLR